MGQVVKAVHKLTDQIVAIKTLSPHLASDPGLRERFLQEARALAGLDHPNIMTLHTFLEDEGRLYLVMQFIDGQDLDAMFRRCGGLSEHATLPIFYRALKGLGYAHRQGIIHRDLKPANILVTRDGRVKLTDFGIARITGGLRLTMTGAQVGTVFYMSPEQIQGTEAETRSDIYAMGVSLYEVLTGRLPFDGDDYTVRKGHVESMPPDPRRWQPQLSQNVVKAVMRSLAKDPNHRFQTAEAFADALGPPGEVLPLIACPLCRSQHPIGEGVTCPSCHQEELCRFHMVAGEGICQPCHKKQLANPTIVQKTLQLAALDMSSDAPVSMQSNPSSSVRQTPSQPSSPSLAQQAPASTGQPIEMSMESLGIGPPQHGAPSSASVGTLLNTTPSSHTLPPTIVTRDGAEMALVPGGGFTLGAHGEPNAQPPREIQLSPYYIDRYPVTNACYQKFLRETGYKRPTHWWDPSEHEGVLFPPELMLHPVVQVSYEDALAYCRWVGKRLPTEAEWEKAARSHDQRLYPWGPQWKDNMAHFGHTMTAPVLAHTYGQSPYSACDMLGNVWEWVQDYYSSDSYNYLEEQDPQGVEQGSFRVVRGGCYRDLASNIRATTRGFRMPHLKGPTVGFRCVLDFSEVQGQTPE
jgi:serine/threonine-protein kinase